MSLITAVEITKLFLYGQRIKPTNFVDENLIRPQDYKYSLIVDINEYMNSPGQFATLDKFKVVQEFFNTPILGLGPGVYTKEDLYALFNITNIQDKIVTINQLGYGTSDPDFVDRAYIWGTTAFQLHNTTRFVISATGERSIVDYAVDPYLGDRNHESFDFASNTFTTQIANAFLEHVLIRQELAVR